MKIPSLVRKSVQSLVTIRPFRMWREVSFRVTEEWYERRLGINSKGYITLDELGMKKPMCSNYAPIQYGLLHQVMKSKDVAKLISDGVCVDYGSGLGRALLVAASYPFKRCIGIEMVPYLHKLACRNLEKAMPNLICEDINFINMDAADYHPADDVTVFVFFNPFSGDILNKVMSNIRISLERTPRNHVVLYIPPYYEKNNMDEFSWLSKGGTFFGYGNRVLCVYRAV